MDTSKKYIEMSEKAEEIQQYHDKIHEIEGDDNWFCSNCGNSEGRNWYAKEGHIWLPRQDQLQRMINWKEYDIAIEWGSLPHKFNWSQDPLEIDGVGGDSMEQLWLAFVMKEKYQKVWNGKDWKKE